MTYYKGFVKFDLMFQKLFVMFNRTTKQRKEKKQSKKHVKSALNENKI